jgi:signal transduction histidine kinase
MDDFAGPAADSSEVFSDRQRVVALEWENQILKNMVASLQANSDAHANAASAARLSLQQLREVNQQLVLATFGAQDSQTEAEAVNRRQGVFLSMLAHELRNPLAPIAAVNSALDQLDIAHPMLPKLSAILRRQLNHLVHLGGRSARCVAYWQRQDFAAKEHGHLA